MDMENTSDALDLTKENIKPLKQGRKPVQLDTALQAQCNMEIQQKLNKEKEIYERAIRTYEGDDPLAPRFEYIKWLEQINLNHGPENNVLPLIEETVQKFKNNSKYKQDPRFIQILIDFIEHQSNAIELYQTVYDQGIGTSCALFYRAWADLLDRYNDFKRVDQIFLLGIQAHAEPADELEQAHVQFQLSIARRLLNGQLQNNEDKNTDPGKRQAFGVLKKSETHSGVRHGTSGLLGKIPQVHSVGVNTSDLRVFEEADENGLPRTINDNRDIVQDGLNKENTVKPGPWTKTKKPSSKPIKTLSAVNFEVHEDNNEESATKLPGITVPNALRKIKGNVSISCPVAIFEPPDPSKIPMYCKDKVYAVGMDIQLEEIRYEIYLKQEKVKGLVKGKQPVPLNIAMSPKKVKSVRPFKKVILPEDNTNQFKVPSLPLRVERDSLNQSVTVNTRAAIDLVQQMWNSHCTDKPDEGNNKVPDKYPNNQDENKANNLKMSGPSIGNGDENAKQKIQSFEVFKNEDDANITHEIRKKMPKAYVNSQEKNNVDSFKIPKVYIDDDDHDDHDDIDENVKQIQSFKVFEDVNENIKTKESNNKGSQSYADNHDKIDENDLKTLHSVYIDDGKALKKMGSKERLNIMNSYENPIKNDKHFEVYEDQIENNANNNITKQMEKTTNNVNPFKDSIEPNDENSPFNKILDTGNDDDMTCSTKAFAFILSSSTPLGQKKNRTRSVIEEPNESIDETENKKTEEFQLGKTLSTIFEASKERNSSASSGLISINSGIKQEQLSSIDFGDSINPFDERLITKLLQNVIKFPNEHHKSGYVEHECDVPSMRSEFKLGQNKMLFLSEIGKGSYARVVKAAWPKDKTVEKALKIQKPACVWEWYISKEIEHRLKFPEKVSYFVNMENMHIFKNGSIISMEFATHGTLLSAIQSYKLAMNQSIPITVAALLSSQITLAVKYLHECQIIHGDLKPDNVVLKSLPSDMCTPCVQLIDFGRCIDMTLFPPKTTFTYMVKTADFICHEMRDKLPWTYQTDYFGLAGIMYMCLMSDYMKTYKLRNKWVLLKPFPRYIDKTLWQKIFNMLLNIESCNNQPNLDEIIENLNKYLSTQQKVVLKHNFTNFKNNVNKH